MSEAEITAAVTFGAKAGTVLRLENLTVERGARPVVHGVSLEVTPGEVTALLGPNGAGKSSLVLAVAGVLPPEAGSIKLAGRELVGRRPEKIRSAGVAVVPEGRRLLPDLTVEDNLQVATYSLPGGAARERREYALELFPELKARLSARARSLSGGSDQLTTKSLVLRQASPPSTLTPTRGGGALSMRTVVGSDTPRLPAAS